MKTGTAAFLYISLATAALSVTAPSSAVADKNSFFRELDTKPQADFRDLVTAIHIIYRDRQDDKPYDQMRAELVAEGVIPADWAYRPDSRVTRGMLAYGICAALSDVRPGEYGVSGSVTMMVFGNSERYAHRECTFLGIMLDGPQSRYVTGEEMLGTIARASRFRKTGKAQTLQLEEEEEEQAPTPVQQQRGQQQEK